MLITPRVISNSDEARQVTIEYTRQFQSLAPLHQDPAGAHPIAEPPPPPPQQPPPAVTSEPIQPQEDRPNDH